MKQSITLFTAILFSYTLSAQTEVSRDASGVKIIKGFLTKKELVTDTAFAWYAQTAKGFTPAAETVQQFKAAKDSVSFIIFGGTWCGDTQHLLPQFLTTADAAGFPENHITLVGVDRSKKTVYNLAEAFNIINVPTFIVMKNGKEIGRVVEYGKIGAPDKEIAQMLSGK